MAQTVKHLPTLRETQIQSLGCEDLLEKEMATTPVFLPGKSHGRWNLVGFSPWGRKESDMTERLHFTSLSIFWTQVPYQTYDLQVSIHFPIQWAVLSLPLFFVPLSFFFIF